MRRIKRSLATVVVAVSLLAGGGGTALVAHVLPHLAPGVVANLMTNQA